jgi:hypothetical protein
MWCVRPCVCAVHVSVLMCDIWGMFSNIFKHVLRFPNMTEIDTSRVVPPRRRSHFPNNAHFIEGYKLPGTKQRIALFRCLQLLVAQLPFSLQLPL